LWAFVLNNSLAAANPTNALLHARARPKWPMSRLRSSAISSRKPVDFLLRGITICHAIGATASAIAHRQHHRPHTDRAGRQRERLEQRFHV